MTNDYTPDTQEVRELYWAVSGLPLRDPKPWEEFDRWLRKVKADAWEQGADAVEQGFIDRLEVVNPYL